VDLIQLKFKSLTLISPFNAFENSKYAIISSNSHINTICSKPNHPYCIVSTLNFLRYYKIIKLCVALFDNLSFFFLYAKISSRVIVLFLIFTIICSCISFQSNIGLRVSIDLSRWLIVFARFKTPKKHFIEDWFGFWGAWIRVINVGIWKFLDCILYLFICVTSWILIRLIVVIYNFREVLEKTLVLFLHVFLIFL